MSYSTKLENGQSLEIDNDGETTHVAFSSGGSSQRQSQSRGFTTGKWTGEPSLFRSGHELILQLPTAEGDKFLRIRDNEIEFPREQPDTSSAEKITLTQGQGTPRMKPMEPMKPMSPMKPMEPMKPMAPMKPMRPM